MTLDWIAPEVMQRLAGSLLHFIWQGAVIAIVAAIGLRLMRHRSAEARYAFAIASLAAMLAAPVFTLAFYAQTGAIAQRLIHMVGQVSVTAQAGVSLETAVWARRILITWCIGVIVFGVRLIVGWRLSWELVRSAQEIVTPSVIRVFESVKERLGLSAPIRLFAHGRLDSPVVVGWLRPVVLMPISLIAGFTEEQLVAMIAHELAHIRRHDFMVNILQRCVESILFYHPAVWWLSKRIRAEREHCCDDVAVQICGSRKVYAEALIELERARQTRPILAVAAADGLILQRFRRVLGLRTSGADWQSAIGTLVFVGIWIVVGMWQSTSTLQARPAQPVATPAAVVALPPSTPPTSPVAESVSAIAAIITAQPTAAPQALPAASDKGVIQGVVTRAGSSQPIPGATVAIVNAPVDPDAARELLAFFAARGLTMNPPEPGQSIEKFMQSLLDRFATGGRGNFGGPDNQLAIERFQDANTAKSSTVADANGRFTLKDVPRGKYIVAAGREGFFVGPGDEAIADVEVGKPNNVVIPLLPGGTITGRVKNAEGKPMPNVNVAAHAITYENGKIYPQLASAQTTDDRGEYRMFWLPPGDYVVVADPPRYPVSASPPPQDAPVAIGRGGPQPPQVMSTPQFMRTFYPQSLNTADARTITIKGGEQLSGMDITVQKGSTYKISGEIHAVVRPAPQNAARAASANAAPNANPRLSVFVGIEHRNPSVIDMRSTTAGGSVPTLGTFILAPGEDGFRGRFELSDILPGEYYLVPRINDSTPAGGQGNLVNRIPVDVRDRDITALTMELFSIMRIEGNVTIDGRAPTDVMVRLTFHADGNPSPIYQGFGTRPTIANGQDGKFGINAHPARFRVEAGPGLPPDLYVSDVRQGAISVFDAGFEVTRDPLVPIQVLLRSGAATAQGVVRDATGKPVPNATVVVVPPDARRDNHELYKTGTTDAMGRFEVHGIAPGSYKIFAWRGIDGQEFYNSRFLSKYEFSGRTINVSQGSTLTESLTLINGN